jgi:hypothetical protein
MRLLPWKVTKGQNGRYVGFYSFAQQKLEIYIQQTGIEDPNEKHFVMLSADAIIEGGRGKGEIHFPDGSIGDIGYAWSGIHRFVVSFTIRDRDENDWVREINKYFNALGSPQTEAKIGSDLADRKSPTRIRTLIS